jgi:hypothetical protein
MDFTTQKKLASKAFYAAIGAPVVMTRKAREVGAKVSDYGTKMQENAQEQLDEFATEGEKFANDVRSRNYVEEIQERVDIEHLQERVEKLRDQLESTLTNWRDSFAPQDEEKAPAAKKPAASTATKPAAKKAPAKTATKTTTAKKPAAKATAAKKPAAKKAPAKTATKATTARKPAATKK